MSGIQSKTFSVVSLGCPKNLVDSEQHVFALKQSGLEFRTEIDGCETVVLNTCGFLQSARDEAREYIDGLIDLKKQGRIGKIVVRGCMPKFEGTGKLAAEFPGVDEWFGIPDLVTIPGERQILTQKHVAYLRIADGCDRRCTFCAIPDIRGSFRSEPMEPLLDEARKLADAGVKELVVIAQETTFWGTDLYGKPRLVELLRKLEEIDGLRWIRLMYAYPLFFGDDLIDLFAAKGKLLPYIDIPLQHANDEILHRMNRRVTKKETEELLRKLRSRIDNLVLRTSLIVGFPGETDEMFGELRKFVEKWEFERAGVFPFSPEKGTPAEKFPNRVAPRIVERRLEKLYKLCEQFSVAWANRQKGKILDVQIDGNYTDESGRKETNLFIGRTVSDAPDIDPVVYVTGEHLEPGSLIPCEILETEGCDLVGMKI
jgi:ribosomal protein S12 methylthiotransferase